MLQPQCPASSKKLPDMWPGRKNVAHNLEKKNQERHKMTKVMKLQGKNDMSSYKYVQEFKGSMYAMRISRNCEEEANATFRAEKCNL